MVGLSAAALGALNLTGAIQYELFEALRSPDAWLPLSASLAGWLVTRLSPANAIGWLLLAIAVSSALFGGAAVVVLGDVAVPSALHATAAWLSAWAFLPAYLLTFLVLPLLYPDGRLPSRHWRPVLYAAVTLVVVESTLLAFGSREGVDPDVANPWRLAPAGAVLDAVEPVVFLSMPLLAVLGAASLIHRAVVAGPAERPLLLALAATVALGIGVLLTTGLGLVLGLLLPVVVAGAVAQRLHDRLGEQLAVAESRAEALRESRVRITAAYDDARRGIERDLHDGAQQSLLALSMGLGRLAGRSEAPVRDDAEHLQHLAQRTLTELRELAAGTYPSALRELGVGAALREAVGPGVQVHDGFGDRPRRATEEALYFACLEAVTNARKHADALCITVTLDRTRDGAFRFTVCDDGTGIAGTTAGSGIDGMADRLGARGGTLTVDSSPGRGTTVRGVVYDAPR